MAFIDCWMIWGKDKILVKLHRIYKKTILADNELANAQVTLYSSTDIEFNVIDTFTIPASNWNRKIDQEGN